MIDSKANPLISVITITFNAAETLPPTVDSLNAQSFRNFEHIIIDGASKDNTLQAASASKNARILSEPDDGLYHAMNKGLEMARGKYVIFLNAGDTFHSPDTLGYYARATERNPDIIYGDTVIVNRDRKVLGPRHLSAPERLTVESFADGMLVCHQAFMVRRSLAPAYDLRYHFSADYDWTIRCMKAGQPGKFINLRRVTVDYLSDGLTDRNHRASLKERFKIMSEHYGLIPTLFRHVSFAIRHLNRKKNK